MEESGLGQYRLIERLGAGGMGEVFLASLERADGFKKLLVVKRILPDLSDSARFREMFSAEARIAAGLNHPGIIQVTDFGYIGHNCFLAMEHIDGCDLAALLEDAQRQRQRIPLDLAAAVGLSCLRALGYAHRRDPAVIHGDVSPANILLGRQGEVKLTDFGLARLAGGGRGPVAVGEIRGKLGYMPPEVAFGQAAQPASDIFGVGAVLYELVAGVGPLARVSGLDRALAQARRCQIPKLSELRPECDGILANIIDRALRPAVEERFESAAEMEAALQKSADRMGLDYGPGCVAAIVNRLEGSGDKRTRQVPRTLVAQPLKEPDRPRLGRLVWLLVSLAAVLTGGLLWYVLNRPPGVSIPSAEPTVVAGAPDGGSAGAPDGAPDGTGGPPTDGRESVRGRSGDAARDAGPGERPAIHKGRRRHRRRRPSIQHTMSGALDGGPSAAEDAEASTFSLSANRKVSIFVDGEAQGHSSYRSHQPFHGSRIIKIVDPAGINATVRVERAANASDVVFAFRSQPFAILSVDQNPRGLTPIGDVRLELGPHIFTLAVPGKRPLVLRISVP